MQLDLHVINLQLFTFSGYVRDILFLRVISDYIDYILFMYVKLLITGFWCLKDI